MKRFAAIILILLIVVFAFLIVSILLQIGKNSESATVEIPKGFSANETAKILYESGVIKRKIDFKIATRILFVSDKLKAGRYKFPAHPLLFQVLFKLKRGEIVGEEPIKVTFPEGTSIYKMGMILQKNGALFSEDFKALVNTRLIKGLKQEFPFLSDIPTRSLEGYLFPDTYIIDKGTSAEALAKLMLKRFSEVVVPYWDENKKATKYDLHQVITLASIIEKEAAILSEQPFISSVFHNRLDSNMALDACPTVKYALERPSKIVYFDQLKVKSPYNTYMHRGLPPGPISNPGLSSIKAAVYPAKTDYYYFVAKADGSHTFSKTWQEHQKARQQLR